MDMDQAATQYRLVLSILQPDSATWHRLDYGKTIVERMVPDML